MPFFVLYTIFQLLLHNLYSFEIEESEIFYQSPYLNIKFMNMTLGITSASISSSTASYAAGLVASICQADKLNRNAYPPINFTGIINLVIQEYGKDDPFGQNAAIKILSNSLYNKTTGASLSSDQIHNLAGFLGTISSGENRINADAGGGFSVPLINPGTLNQVNPNDRYAIFSKLEERTFFSVRDTILYSNLNVLLDLMKAYNWTIGANIYEDNTFGLGLEQQVEIFKSLYYSPIFTCSEIVGVDDLINQQFYVDYCRCMTNINKLNLISLWMSPILAYRFIRELKNNCKAAEDFVYVVTSESEPLPSAIYYDDTNFKSVFIIRPFGGLNFTSFLSECLETSSPQATTSMNRIVDELLLNSYKCYRNVEDTTDLEACTDDIFNRTSSACTCTGAEFNPESNPYSVN
jgi:hypothetical protein